MFVLIRRFFKSILPVLFCLSWPVMGHCAGDDAMPIHAWLSHITGQKANPAEGWMASNPEQRKSWALKVEDVRLDRAIGRWAKDAGYSFRWDADRYVLIAAPTIFDGEFTEAVQQLLETPGIVFSEYPLEACVYNNKPPLLRITRLGDQTQECR